MIDISIFNNYRVGDDAMDSQHWQVIQMLKDVHSCPDVTHAVLKMDSFMVEWQKHLAHEELFMARLNFPYLEAHRAIHAELLKGYAAIREAVFQDRLGMHRFRHYAKQALSLVLDHIDLYDRQYGDWAKQNPSHSA